APRFKATLEDIIDEPAGSIAANRIKKMLLLTWHESSETTKEPVCDSVTPSSLPQHDSSTPCKDSVCESITPSGPGNDEEKNYRKRRLAELRKEMEGVINASGQWKYSFYTGKKFTTPKEAKDRVYLHSIESRRNLKLYKNDSTVPTGLNSGMEAGPSGSSGLITRSKKEKIQVLMMTVKHLLLFLMHMIKGISALGEIKHCTYKFLSEKIFEQVRVNPDIPVKVVQDQLQRELEVQISMSKAFRAKAKAEREIRGHHVLQHFMLRDYVVELQSTNPNTTVKIVVERNTDPSLPTRVFQRIYVCLVALKLGFRACGRDLLGLDGAFMKGSFPGQVLVAVGLDSNNGITIGGPNFLCWLKWITRVHGCWFLQCLGDARYAFQISNFTFICDRHQCIISAIKTVYLSAEHKYCLRHIHENMKQGWCGQAYKDLLWRAASATNVRDLEKCMLELKTMNPKAHEWLNKIPAEHWARSLVWILNKWTKSKQKRTNPNTRRKECTRAEKFSKNRSTKSQLRSGLNKREASKMLEGSLHTYKWRSQHTVSDI
ncbi:heat stress transcription factor B-4-like protein, partial [Tanacetum coccineum]